MKLFHVYSIIGGMPEIVQKYSEQKDIIALKPHPYAVRVYSGQLEIDHIQTLKGKKFTLLNLPFYLTGCISEYLEWIISK